MEPRHSVLLIGCALLAMACADPSATPFSVEGLLYEVAVEAQTGEEKFRIRLKDAERIAAANQMLASGERRTLMGELAAGNGGFNQPYRWHLQPESVHFPDLSMELCDGTPSMVEQNLTYWINTVRVYCPWGVRIVRRLSG
jgi:hypothetical protein